MRTDDGVPSFRWHRVTLALEPSISLFVHFYFTRSRECSHSIWFGTSQAALSGETLKIPEVLVLESGREPALRISHLKAAVTSPEWTSWYSMLQDSIIFSPITFTQIPALPSTATQRFLSNNVHRGEGIMTQIGVIVAVSIPGVISVI